ncbi:MAG: hypothetical protein JWN19_2766 [Arthrobacter sp.]|nr:hypothetical protein [Arthrobacter sp.]
MSNPNDVPPPQQPGAQPPQPGNVPPAGSEPPRPGPPARPGYQPPQQGQYGPPPGYQPPQQGYGQAPGYQPPGQPGAPGGFRFEMPADRPRNVSDVMPQGGFSGMFSVAGMPTELKVSYWIWLIGGLLGLLGGVIGLFGSFVLLAVAPGIGIVVLLLVLVALALAAAQIILAMKMKEGREWARFALTILAGVSLLLTVISASATDGRSGSSWPGFIISLAATVLMWLPNSQAWFASLRGRV